MAISTSTTVLTVKEIHSPIEDAFVFDRENGQHFNMAVQHFNQTYEMDIVVFLDHDRVDEVDVLEKVTLSLAEAKHLRTLLNDPRVVALLDQQ